MDFKKTISIILSLIMILSLSSTSFAYDTKQDDVQINDNVIQPRFTYIRSFQANMYVSGSTITGCTNIETSSGTTVKVKMYVERKNGSTWDTVGTILASGNFNGGSLEMISNSRVVNSGYEYRIHSFVEIYVNNVKKETDDVYSTIKYI